MEFDLPKDQTSIIKVFGVGGGGSNAVNHMYKQGITGVDFVVCNTDNQALDISPVPTKIQLGRSLTEGRGAGSIAEVGRNAAIEDIEQIREILAKNTKMVFITAGMGGGTGTGAAPVIAETAKEMGILTVGIVTMPFMFEGRKRKQQASEGIEEFRKHVDTLLVINNDKLREIFGNLSLGDAFGHADNVLTTAAKGIAEIITVTGSINVDFEDVRTVMTDSGVAIMGSAKASGENRALHAVEEALASPLLNDNNITGARYVLLNITYGKQEVLMDEIMDITDFIQDASGNTADVIWGHGMDESLEDEVCVTIIATGFNSAPDTGAVQEVKKTVISLDADVKTNLTSPIHQQPVVPTPQPQKEVVETPKSEIEEPYLKTTETPTENNTNPPANKTIEQGTINFEVTTPSAPENKNNLVSETPDPIQEEPKEVIRHELGDFEDDDFDLTSEQEDASTEEMMDIVDDVTYEAETPIQKVDSDNVERPSFTFQAPVNEVNEEEQQIEASSTTETEGHYEEPYMKSTEADVTAQYNSQEKNITEQTQSSVQESKPAESESRQMNTYSPEEQQVRTSQRISKLKELSMRLRTPSGISDLENEPAYKRRNVQLEDTPHSSESQVSRFTLGKDDNDEGKSSLRGNNSFLHDNVD